MNQRLSIEERQRRISQGQGKRRPNMSERARLEQELADKKIQLSDLRAEMDRLEEELDELLIEDLVGATAR
jgi:hypothetical protein